MIALPLETALHMACEEREEYYEYYAVYMAMKTILQNRYYPYIRDVNPFYTDHGINHVNRILTLLNDLLQPHLINERETVPQSRRTVSADLLSKKLNVYELYLLLCSVIWHDIGNLYGRKDHNKKIFRLFNKAKNFLHDKKSSEWIKNICEAHSGKDAVDKIDSERMYEKQFKFYPRFLAALLRFCDELDEGKERIGEQVYAQVPKQQRVYWFFCKCNDSIHVERNTDSVKIVVFGSMDKAVLYERFIKEDKKVIAISEYIARINKINKERIYCNKFYQPHYFKHIEKIELHFRIYDKEKLLKEILFDFNDHNGEDEFFKTNNNDIDLI